VLTPFRINTRTHMNMRREDELAAGDRSDRSQGAVRLVTAGENGDEPTSVSPGRPVGAGARRVVLGSAGYLERPQST